VLPQRFVRAFVVELVEEAVESSLLSPAGGRWRPGGFGFQRTMHTFMAAVLFGVGRLDQLRVDAQSDPPDRESGEPSDRAGGEGRAVVGADDLWQSELTKQAPKDCLCSLEGWAEQRLAAQDVSAEAIGHGEGIAVLAVAGAKLSFEISRPDLVGGRHRGLWSSWMARSAAAAGVNTALSLEDVTDRAPGRPGPIRMASHQNRQQLLGPPAGMMAASLQHGLHNTGSRLVGAALGASRPIQKTGGTLGPVARQPLVSGLSADAEPLTELCHAEKLSEIICHEQCSLVHG
jgi:hypothetical protein